MSEGQSYTGYQLFETMSINSVMISCVKGQYSQEYIANVFWRQHIAKVSSITLMPYLKNGGIYNIAYISIDEWCDSEASYNFINRLKVPSNEARLVHYDDDWWPVEINTHNDGNMNVGSYTKTFTPDYFEYKEDKTDECSEDDATEIYTADEYEYDYDYRYDYDFKEFDAEHPINGLGNERYRPEEAEARLKMLRELWTNAYNRKVVGECLEEIEEELSHFDTQLRMHYALKDGHNLTLKKNQQSRFAKIHPINCDVGVQC